MDRGPVFVAGIERSGTSLIYALLASHPNIAMTRRTNLWRFFNNRFGDLRRPDNFERCLDAMARYKRLQAIGIDPERVRREFWLGEPSYGRLFRLLAEHYLEKVGKPRWGDKSLYTERYLDDVFAVYPTAKVIHMVRDPRDRYASARKRWSSGRGGVGVGTAKWLASVRWANLNQQRYPSQYMVVRYETLAAHPEETLREVCAFIGEEYSPAMLSMDGARGFRETGGNSSYGRREAGRISTQSVGRFRQVMTKSEIAFMQAWTGAGMAAFGYEPEPLALSLAEQVRCYSIDWASQIARMAAWLARDALAEAIGRAPSRHTIVASSQPAR